MSMTDRIAVDFDNTLTQDDVEYWNDERPKPDTDMVQWVNEQYFADHTILIWTARPEEVRAQTQRWLNEWNVRHHALVMEKLSADTFVDDKSKRPTEVKG